ncbi:MAG: hypothetical protein GY705_24350 [Bacteroidetes bacterium]|nr:hypothetical protein [Bacteroidota bacterium]
MRNYKHFALTFFALMICFSLTAQLFPLRRANKQYDLHAYNMAIKSYIDYLRKHPDNKEVMGKLGDCYWHINQLSESAKWYAKATEQNTIDPQYILNYGKVLMGLGDYEKAKTWFLVYAQSNPTEGNHFVQSCDFAKARAGLSSMYMVNNEFTNTTASEFGPAFFKDQIVFSSARTDIRRSSTDWTGKANNQLFIANRGLNGYLEAPVFLKSDMKNAYNEGPVSFSSNGRWVVHTKNNFVDGTRHLGSSGMEMSLYVAEVAADESWINEKPFPFNGVDYSTGFPCLSPDGNSLYFASDRPDGFGGYDIYVSQKVGNTWSTPENLGSAVNSQGNEVTPYFDGNVLYFSSDWHNGFGGYDVFRAERETGSWRRIFHLGTGVNTSRDDYGFIFNGMKNMGYLTSNRIGGKGVEDIFKVTKVTDNLVIRVKNASNGSPVSNASVDFSSCGEGVFITDGNGIYSFQAAQGLDCDLVIRKEGFMSSYLKVSASGYQANRDYEVLLRRVGEEYVGSVINSRYNSLLEGVNVRATNQTSGQVLESFTNTRGEYAMSLSPNSVYVIRYSKAGFTDVNRTVRTNTGSDKSILGIIPLLPSSTAVTGREGYMGTGTTGGATSTTYPSTTTYPPSTTGSTSISVPSGGNIGYAVQVAALSRPTNSGYENLTAYGDVYYYVENGKYKARVGVFGSKNDARQVLQYVKSKGYPSAFIATENMNSYVERVAIASSNTMSSPSSVTSSTYTPGNTSTSSHSTYMVRLASYTNTRWFDDTNVRGLGVIEERRKGQWTIMLLGGYSSLQDAQRAMQYAKAAGFKEAHVVTEVSGELKKVK